MIHMELQLGLALPSITDVKGLDVDLNSYYMYEPKENDFGSSGSVPSKCSSTNNNDVCNNDNRKRCFGDAFEFEQLVKAVVPRTLPLLNWNKHPDDDEHDHHPKDLDNNSSFGSNKTIDEDGIVGWPPIKNLRKKLCYQHHGGGGVKNNQTVANGNSMFVKVKMEGVIIARKIDLSLYDSFETLRNTLISMFGLWYQDSHNYQLTYQDREGEWLIAQDVPWRTFIRTVQRLKLSKSSN